MIVGAAAKRRRRSKCDGLTRVIAHELMSYGVEVPSDTVICIFNSLLTIALKMIVIFDYGSASVGVQERRVVVMAKLRRSANTRSA